MTQQNAALVEQAAAAAESMQTQSAALAQVVSVFKLQEGGGQAVRLAPPQATASNVPKRVATAPSPRAISGVGEKPREGKELSLARAKQNVPAGGTDDWEEF